MQKTKICRICYAEDGQLHTDGCRGGDTYFEVIIFEGYGLKKDAFFGELISLLRGIIPSIEKNGLVVDDVLVQPQLNKSYMMFSFLVHKRQGVFRRGEK